MNKQNFLDAYQERLRTETDWGKEPDKLANFMSSVSWTIRTRATTWNFDSDIAKSVWRANMPGVRYSLKALRALPDPE